MLVLSICDNSSMLNVILFIKNIINIIFIVVPLVLALLFTIDLFKNIFAKDDNENQKNLRLGIKRIVYSLILMFIPLLIDTFMSAIKDYSKVANCYEIASEEKVQELYEQEEAEYQRLREEKKKERQEQAAIVDSENKASAKATKKALQEVKKEQAKKAQEKINESSSTSSSSSLDLSKATSGAEKIALTAEKLAWPHNTQKKKLSYPYGRSAQIRKWSQLTKGKPTQVFMNEMDRVYPDHFKWGTGYPAIRPGASCDTFVGVTVKASGYDTIGKTMGQLESALNSHTKKWKRVSTAKRGDICQDSHHIKIYLGNGKIAQASYAGFFGKIDNGNCNHSVRIWRAKK